jgi:hypothetical protein
VLPDTTVILLNKGYRPDCCKNMRLRPQVSGPDLRADPKEGLAAARAKGRLLGRPKGSLGTSKLDGKEEEIWMILEKEVSKASIAKIMGISWTALHHFIQTRKLESTGPNGR